MEYARRGFFKEGEGENPKEVSDRVRGRHGLVSDRPNVNASATTFCMTWGKGLVRNQGVKMTPPASGCCEDQ